MRCTVRHPDVIQNGYLFFLEAIAELIKEFVKLKSANLCVNVQRTTRWALLSTVAGLVMMLIPGCGRNARVGVKQPPGHKPRAALDPVPKSGALTAVLKGPYENRLQAAVPFGQGS